jgi:hypothetical protein
MSANSFDFVEVLNGLAQFHDECLDVEEHVVLLILFEHLEDAILAILISTEDKRNAEQDDFVVQLQILMVAERLYQKLRNSALIEELLS